MDKSNKIPGFSAMGKDLIKNASRYAGSESVKYFKESFVNQGFNDTSFVAWPKTTNPMAGKRTLYKSGTLMQSIRKTEGTITRIVVESDTDYSEIHNNGGTITVTPQMKKFFWAKFYEFSGNIKLNKEGTAARLSKSNNIISVKAMFFRRMALMKVGAKIKIPKRQFMGNSQTMMTQFDKWWLGQIDISFKQHLNKE